MHLPSHLLTLDIEDVSGGGVAERAEQHDLARFKVRAYLVHLHPPHLCLYAHAWHVHVHVPCVCMCMCMRTCTWHVHMHMHMRMHVHVHVHIHASLGPPLARRTSPVEPRSTPSRTPRGCAV